jgi:hypothetical protein
MGSVAVDRPQETDRKVAAARVARAKRGDRVAHRMDGRDLGPGRVAQPGVTASEQHPQDASLEPRRSDVRGVMRDGAVARPPVE